MATATVSKQRKSASAPAAKPKVARLRDPRAPAVEAVDHRALAIEAYNEAHVRLSIATETLDHIVMHIEGQERDGRTIMIDTSVVQVMYAATYHLRDAEKYLDDVWPGLSKVEDAASGD